jgi:hypothetical protein
LARCLGGRHRVRVFVVLSLRIESRKSQTGRWQEICGATKIGFGVEIDPHWGGK